MLSPATFISCLEYDHVTTATYFILIHSLHDSLSGNYLLREAVIDCRKDVGHEGTVLDVLVITNDMDSIVTGLSGPIAHITGAITLIITLNFSL